MSDRWTRTIAAAVVALTVSASYGCRDSSLANINQLIEARRLASDALVQLSKSVDAGNRAVMADTDDASTAFARESEDAKAALLKDGEILGSALRNLGYSNELSMLEEFDRRFAEYRELDRGILDLAVQNTNLKAQRLSFGPAFEAADAFSNVLHGLPADGSLRGLRIQAEVVTAVAAVREMQALQAPHIAESDDAAMTRLEKRAAGADAAARRALETLGGLVAPSARESIARARDALDRFVVTNTEIVALSRRNSNVRSLALSLGQKRTVAASCEDSLRALHDALAKRGFAGTR